MAVAALLVVGGAQAAPLTTEDFFRRPQFYEALISPSGKSLAITLPVDGKVELAVFGDVSAQPLQPTARFDMKGDVDIYQFHWVGDEQLVFDSAEHTHELALPILHRDLIRASLAEHKVRNLFNSSYADFISDGQDGRHVLVEARGKAQELDVATGDFKEITEDTSLDYPSYVSNHKGQVTIAIGWKQWTHGDDDRVEIHYRDPASTKWTQVDIEADNLEDERTMYGLGFSPDDKTFYFGSDDNGTTYGIYAIDLESKQKRLVFRDPARDVGRTIYASDDQTPIGVMMDIGDPRPVFFDENSAEAKALKDIYGLFPGEYVYVSSHSKDGSRALATVYNDHRPSRCYLIDLKAGEVRELFDAAPWIDPKQLSPVRAIHIQARDGVKLEGFLTVPANSSGKDLPLVVLPHGGPIGIADEQEYDPQVQFLAYHGYAVLQVNYRGSSGYGRAFLKAGFRQWGEKIQDDIIDATHWVMDQGIADKNRACIFGASFGGYSALEAPIRAPGLFKCAIGYAGVYDLKLTLVTTNARSKFLHHIIGDYDSHLDQFSPALHADQVGIPVFLAHGKEDPIAPFENFERMSEALKDAGNPAEVLMPVPTEMHGFYKVENRVAFYDKVLAFLDRHIGSAAKPAQTAAVQGAPEAAAAPAPTAH